MKFSPEVKKLFEIFGDDIRLVGGCVRDMILEKEVNDFDFATRFLPEETLKILEKNKIKAVPTGVKFGTITAVINGKNFEITTLRKDNETDGRYCEPEFVDDFFLDASRRDFTGNALYLDSTGKITDYFNGISDLKNQKIRFIGDANKRIEEDYLRILRFFRFSARYASSLDLEGLNACIKNKSGLKKLSRERIRQEFLKLLASPNKKKVVEILRTLKNAKITDEIFSSKLDIPAFERLQSDDSKLQIAALLLNENFNFEEICPTNFEKKLWSNLLRWSSLSKEDRRSSLSKEDRRSSLSIKDRRSSLSRPGNAELDGLDKLDQRFINELRAFSDDEFAWNFCLFVAAKKNLSLPKKFEKLPEFPLKSSDLIALGFKDKALGEALNKAKKLWAESDFKLPKQSLLNSQK